MGGCPAGTPVCGSPGSTAPALSGSRSATYAASGFPPPYADGRLDADGGRGLALVAALAEDWGVIPPPGAPGKTVWAVVTVDPKRHRESRGARQGSQLRGNPSVPRHILRAIEQGPLPDCSESGPPLTFFSAFRVVRSIP
jgi:hypothetical protein